MENKTSTPSQVEEWKERLRLLDKQLMTSVPDCDWETLEQFITSLLQEQGEKKDREWREITINILKQERERIVEYSKNWSGYQGKLEAQINEVDYMINIFKKYKKQY